MTDWRLPFDEVEQLNYAALLNYARTVEHKAAELEADLASPPVAFYLVWRDGANSTPHVKHPDLATAQIQAERLARGNPGHRFYVLPGFAYAVAEINPVAWRSGDPSEEEIPF